MDELVTASYMLDEQLAPYGRMNFSQDCWVDGHPARIAMNAEQVFVAVADGATPVVAETFARVSNVGEGMQRAIALAGTTREVTFEELHSAERFDRVLEVRRDAPLAGRLGSYQSYGYADGAAGQVFSVTDPARSYAQYVRYVMAASMLLLVLGWVDLGGGVIYAFVLFVKQAPLAGLLMLVFAVAGCAVPLCLGCLARMLVYRFRMRDEAA